MKDTVKIKQNMSEQRFKIGKTPWNTSASSSQLNIRKKNFNRLECFGQATGILVMSVVLELCVEKTISNSIVSYWILINKKL